MLRGAVLVALILFGFSICQGEPSKTVRTKLFRQVLADDAELRECLKEQEGGVGAAEEGMTVVWEPFVNAEGVRKFQPSVAATWEQEKQKGQR